MNMKNFTYNQPRSLKEAAQAFKANPNALPSAGGTDLLGLVKDNVLRPDVVVNLKKIPGLDKIAYSPGKGLTIGSLVKVAEVAANPDVLKKFPALAQAAKAVASPQLRNMGTIGGNLCQRPRCWYFRGDFNCLRKGGSDCFAVEGENKFHCIIGGGPCFIVHPSDTAVALMALDATLVVQQGKKKRKIPITDFFVLPAKKVTKENVLEPGDILVEIFVPDNGTLSKFLKFTERDVWDFATVSGAVAWTGDKNKVNTGRLVLGGVAPIPWLEKDVGAALAGVALDKSAIETLAAKALKDAEPLEQNEYKIQLARNLIKQLFVL